MPNQNEVSLLRDQITEEVNRDAEVLGGQLFAGNAQSREPDLSRVSEDNLQAMYRQKYLDQDREWLTSEAQRDPQQFVRVAQAIGVVLPSQLPNHVPPVASLPQGPVPIAPPAVAPPMDPQAVQAALMQSMGAPPTPAQQAPPPLPGMIPNPAPIGPQPVIAPPIVMPQ